MRTDKIKLIINLLLLICIFNPFEIHSAENIPLNKLQFKQLSTLNGLPNDEVQKVYQDKDGFMWFATRYGLCKYDGYEVTLYKSNLYTPDLLTNNNILCLTEDANHNIWIGTIEGINTLDKQTGIITKGKYPEIGTNTVSCLLVDKDHKVWVGTDVGLFRYCPEKDSMELISGEKTGNILGVVSIKSLFQDSDGDIWIGTWSAGLYRYVPSGKKFYTYPKMNQRNSAHVIYEDSRKNIWIVGWGAGLYRLNNPKNISEVSWVTYRHDANDPYSLSDNVVYDICEDINTGNLWVGTRSGLSILADSDARVFRNYKSSSSAYHIPCDEINSIVRDQSGNMWIGAIGGGVLMSDTRKSNFAMYHFDLAEDDIPSSSVRSLLVDSNNCVWMGVGTYGLAMHDRKNNQFKFYSRLPEFSEVRSMPTVYAILERRKAGEIWFGAYDGGLFVYKQGRKVQHYNTENSDFIKHLCITALYEDSKGNCWIGTRYGLGVKRADGTGFLFNSVIDNIDMEFIYTRNIMEDSKGNIWLATTNHGLVRISGDINVPQSLKYGIYTTSNGKIPTKHIICIKEDNLGRLWAGTESHGLFLYDEQTDSFITKNRQYNIPGDMVGSIEMDNAGNLWLGTNSGLVRLKADESESTVSMRVYTSADGLQDNFFIPRSSYKKGSELFFGGFKGYNSFFPEQLSDSVSKVPFAVTDIKIYNKSFHMLEESLRNKISAKTPLFTEKIDLPYKYNNFSIEFASLTYKNPELNKYAYKLEGFDKNWQYTDANRHFAYYNNLQSGNYTFLLKATNENGIWSEQVKKLSVIIHPPLWATWWAYLLYGLAGLLIFYFIYRTARNRMILKNTLQLQKLEQAKAEELNHSKLQFFTNITHELLTPLTIISATVDELKIQAPQYNQLYPIINTNIQRLIRLLQQILEFRKAETGNLKLRVSPGDIAQFVRNAAEAFQPLIKKRKLHFSLLCDPDSIIGYFDTDKLDKILYNLLSNAAKYNKEGGYIQLNLSYHSNKDYVLISVKDSGTGISKENQSTLFKRFYEGDYRRFHTIGTGIGLSLVKDLVDLHGGEITVESEINQGTTFVVKIPIERSYYSEDEIDEQAITIHKTISGIVTDAASVAKPIEAKNYSVLVLEDNQELLEVMTTLLSREYNIYTAENGKEGVVIMENEDIDLVVSDIMMPEMDGIEFCKLIKSSIEFSHVPVILLTAKNKEEDRAEAYESGADGFISKPFSLTVLHARIKNLLKYKERMAKDFKNQLVFEVKDLNYTSLDEEFMRKAIECVNRHLDDPDFDQPQFIDEMGTSKSTLYKKLKSLTGLNTSAFIRNIRLKAAVKMMEEKKNIRVSELAYAVGFNDPKYFSSCFKKEFNMLPSEYMDRFIPDK